jgi:hypothetical protein
MSQREARKKRANPQSLSKEKSVTAVRSKPISFTRGSSEWIEEVVG